MKFAGCLLLLCIGLAGCSDKSEPGADGNTVDFRLDTFDHQRFYLNEHRSKTVVLAFWSTWCTVCKAELLELEKMSVMPEFKNTVFAAVCNDPENAEETRQVIGALGLKMPVLLDRDAQLWKKLGLCAVPATVIIDRGGRMSFVREGYSPAILKQIKSKIEMINSEAFK